MKRKTRITTAQVADMKTITQWLIEHTQVTTKQQAAGWAYLIVTDNSFDWGRPCTLSVSGAEIQVPSVESLNLDPSASSDSTREPPFRVTTIQGATDKDSASG